MILSFEIKSKSNQFCLKKFLFVDICSINFGRNFQFCAKDGTRSMKFMHLFALNIKCFIFLYHNLICIIFCSKRWHEQHEICVALIASFYHKLICKICVDVDKIVS